MNKKKGIDVHCIQVVGQWRINKVDFCTLSQRFGRAARDPNIEGIGVVLVEPDIFDEVVEDIDVRKKKKRRRKQSGRQAKRVRVDQPRSDSASALQSIATGARMSGESQGTPLALQGASPDTQMSGESQETQGAVEHDDDEDDDIEAGGNGSVNPTTEPLDFAERWTTYFEWSDCPQGLTGSKNSPGIDPALRDLVRGIPCRRIPGKVYYSKNKELGKSSSLRR